MERKLAAVLCADAVGYSRLTDADEVGTHRLLRARLQDLMATIERFGGRIVHTAGDAVLAEFASVVAATEAAVDAQRRLGETNSGLSAEHRLDFRIGLNLGDIMVDGVEIYGTGVNVAARLETLADPGGICVSQSVLDLVGGQLPLSFEDRGEQKVKNIAKPVRAFRICLEERRRAPLVLKLLGELEVSHEGRRIELPHSRKTRALLAYLVVTGKSHRRERLISLLWDIPDDPKGALRWSLSKLRKVVDGSAATRIIADRESVSFAAVDADIDVLEIRQRLAVPPETFSTGELTELAAAFRGEFLEGLELPECNDFQAWLVAQREEMRRHHAEVLTTLAARLRTEPDRALPYARSLVQIDPYDEATHVRLINLLAEAGRDREGKEAYRAGRRLLAEAGAPSAALERAQAVFDRGGHPPHVETVLEAEAVPQEGTIDKTSGVETTEAQPALTGRSEECARLKAAVEAVSAQHRQRIVLLTGEPGVGKSRLLFELKALIRRGGGTILDGCAYEAESGQPFGPWIDALRRVSASSIGRELGASLAPLLPEFSRGAEAEVSRTRLFGAVVELIAARAHSAPPVLIVIDDLHWCDEATASLIHYVARMSRHRPVLIALAARDSELPDNQPVQGLVRGLRHDVGLEEIGLARLSREDTVALARQLRGDIDPERVFEASGGNPLFTIELARTPSSRAEDLPSSLTTLVSDRVSRLPPLAVEVLRWASVLGQSCRVDMLANLASLDGSEFMSALETLERYALLAADRSGRSGVPVYEFTHAMVRRVIYGDISEPRRRLMHHRAAEALEQLKASDEAVVTAIAFHASLAGEPSMAARACLAAGRRCVRFFASGEAEAFARRGLRHAEQLSDPERVRLQIELHEVSIAARRPGDVEEVARLLEGLAEHALDCGAVEHARRGFNLVGFLRWESGDWNAAERLNTRAEQLGKVADEIERVVANADVAHCLTLLERDLGRAEALLLEARAMSERTGTEPYTIPDGMGLLRLYQGRSKEAGEAFDRARTLARRDGDRLGEFQALEHRIMLEVLNGRYAEAEPLCDALVVIGNKLREGSEIPVARVLSCLCAYSRDSETVHADLETALQGLRVADAKHRLAFALTRAAEIDLQGGRSDMARRRAEEALVAATTVGRRSEIVFARVALARVAAALEDAAALEAHLAALNEIAGSGTPAHAVGAAERAASELAGGIPDVAALVGE